MRVRAATVVEAVLAEEAVLMAEVLVATEDADNIRQQTTISIEARGKAVSGGGNDRGVVMAVATTATTVVVTATQQWLQQ